MKYYSVFLLIPLFILSCSTIKKKEISPYYSYKTECVQKLNDGKQRLKVWGQGISKVEAIENAQKQALTDVLFYGITKGRGACSIVPVITDGREQYMKDNYIAYFFEKKKRYRNIISIVGNKYKSEVNKDNIRVEIIVDIDMIELKEEVHSIKDKIK